MFNYYLRLAVRSLRRNPVMTALMVLAIGLGIGASMTTYAAFRAYGSDPIPEKSGRLFVPQIDMWGPSAHSDDNEPPDAIDYTDAMALMRAHAATRQSALYPVSFSLIPEDASQKAFDVQGHAVFADFFAMTDAPFHSGSAWAASDDEARTPVIVIGSELNSKLFGQQSGLGRTINLDGSSFRVVGVLDAWNPQPRYYDLGNSDAFGDEEDFFIPFHWAVDHQTQTNGNNNCNTDPPPGWDAYLNSSCVWMSLLVELPTAADSDRYRQFLDGYALEQKRQGRFNWAPNNRLRDLPQWLTHEQVVPKEVQILMLIAFGFLAVCLVNAVGLMLAKFLRRAPEIGVRRALGASRREIYVQFLVEAGVIGLAGGALGLVLTALGQWGLHSLFSVEVAKLGNFDPLLMVLTLALSLIASLIAGLYPTARAAAVRPAWQLKSN